MDLHRYQVWYTLFGRMQSIFVYASSEDCAKFLASGCGRKIINVKLFE